MSGSSRLADTSRTIEVALADLRAKFSALPMTDPRRGWIAMRIVWLEDAIERRKVTTDA